jgi:hypothetical protein
MADERLGDPTVTAIERARRHTFVNLRMAIAAGWTDDEWRTFVDTGRYPTRDMDAENERRTMKQPRQSPYG